MAEKKQQKREREFDCPHCKRKVPGKARFCPFCSRPIRAVCSRCKYELPIAAGYHACINCGYAEGVQDLLTGGGGPRRCSFCRRELAEDASFCAWCGTHTAQFVRFCPFSSCQQPVDLKANKCDHCGRSFRLSVVGVFGFVRCLNPLCNRGSELDDFMADRWIPYLFRTLKGVKLAGFSLTDAAEMWKCYFEERGKDLPLEEVERMLAASDEAPWQFRDERAALGFLQHFRCTCGAKLWKLDRGMALLLATRRAASPVAQTGGGLLVKVAKWAWGQSRNVTTGAAREAQNLLKRK